MADLNPTSADVIQVDGESQTAILGEACVAGDLLAYITADRHWILLDSDIETDLMTAQALSDGAAGQKIAVAKRGSTVDMGTILTTGEIYVSSPTGPGKIAPVGDYTPGVDPLIVVGWAKTNSELYLSLQWAGIELAT